MTLDWLLRTPLMANAEVLVGEEHLLRDVTWCVPDTSLKFENFIMPGLLLIYTGDYKSFLEYADFLFEQMPAGIVLMGKDSMSDEELALCERRGLPVIHLPSFMSKTGFMKRFSALASRAFDNELQVEEWLRAFCYSDGFYTGKASRIVQGYSDAYRYCCMIVRSRHLLEGTQVEQEMARRFAAELLIRELSYHDTDVSDDRNSGWVLRFIEEDRIVCFVPCKKDATAAQLRDRLVDAIARLRKLSGIRWVATVGPMAQTLMGFRESFSLALRTIDVIEALGVYDHVTFYDDWYMHMLLLKEPRAELEEHMEHVIGPILDHPELVDTLANYLTFGESLKITSEKMFIHVNTLKYRLKRIEELLVCDLGDPNVRFRLRMAITIERYLRAT